MSQSKEKQEHGSEQPPAYEPVQDVPPPPTYEAPPPGYILPHGNPTPQSTSVISMI